MSAAAAGAVSGAVSALSAALLGRRAAGVCKGERVSGALLKVACVLTVAAAVEEGGSSLLVYLSVCVDECSGWDCDSAREPRGARSGAERSDGVNDSVLPAVTAVEAATAAAVSPESVTEDG